MCREPRKTSQSIDPGGAGNFLERTFPGCSVPGTQASPDPRTQMGCFPFCALNLRGAPCLPLSSALSLTCLAELHFLPAPPGGLSTMPGREYDKALASVPGDCQELTSCQTAVATHGSGAAAMEAVTSLHLFCAWHSADHLSVLFHLILTITL